MDRGLARAHVWLIKLGALPDAAETDASEIRDEILTENHIGSIWTMQGGISTALPLNESYNCHKNKLIAVPFKSMLLYVERRRLINSL